MFAEGCGVEKSDIEAVKWWRKAADQGIAQAHYNLGGLFENGRGVAQSDEEAVK
jgi:TPR repeat protein